MCKRRRLKNRTRRRFRVVKKKMCLGGGLIVRATEFEAVIGYPDNFELRQAQPIETNDN